MKLTGFACYLITAFLMVLSPLSSPLASPLASAQTQVPFGDAISNSIYNYHRHTPTIATSGSIASGGLSELKQKGFKTIVDFRTPAEGTVQEAKQAKALGLNYINLAVGTAWPSDELLAEFYALVEDPKQHPILLHCASANRVGMLWAYYRLQRGMGKSGALEEGRTIGMKPNRERVLLNKVSSF